MTKEEAIENFIATARPRDFKQALFDSEACCESRGHAGRTLPSVRGKTLEVPGITPAPRCDCFCCSLVTTLRARGWEIQRAMGRVKMWVPFGGFGNGGRHG